MRLDFETENTFICSECIKKMIFRFTFATVIITISRVTSHVTVTSPFVTWRVIQAVTTTGFDTVISICTIITTYNRY